MRPLHVAVVGSRDFFRPAIVERLVYSLPNNIVIVTGGARGVDKWAEDTARYWKKDVVVYPAEWKKYGKNAGFIRNNKIVKSSDLIIAFWDGKSQGTRHTVQLSRHHNKPCIIIRGR